MEMFRVTTKNAKITKCTSEPSSQTNMGQHYHNCVKMQIPLFIFLSETLDFIRRVQAFNKQPRYIY